MKHKWTHILFDLDGTLTDSSEGIINSIKYSLKKMGITDYSEDTLRQFVGPPLQKSYPKHFDMTQDEMKQAVEFYREYFLERGMLQENKLYPGIPELLEKLKQAGKHIHLATAKPQPYAEKIVDHFGIHHYFDIISGSNLDGTGTDKAHVIGYIIEEKKQNPLFSANFPGNCVMIGDKELDVFGAKKCGISVIGAGYGYGIGDELTEAKPDFTAESVEELGRLLLL